MNFIIVNYVFLKKHVDLREAVIFHTSGYIWHNNSRVLFNVLDAIKKVLAYFFPAS